MVKVYKDASSDDKIMLAMNHCMHKSISFPNIPISLIPIKPIQRSIVLSDGIFAIKIFPCLLALATLLPAQTTLCAIETTDTLQVLVKFL